MKFLFLSLLAITAFFSSQIQAENLSVLAPTQSGVVKGLVLPGVQVFKGIPYAQPPVGTLRFRKPELPKSWSGVRAATAFASSCPVLRSPKDQEPFVQGNEDCLYLNVWSPSANTLKKPVMVFIHGGGFVNGSTSGPFNDPTGAGIVNIPILYDASRFAISSGAVIVTVDYRLGALGFTAHPDFTSELGTSGNFGMLDMIAALNWVQNNISAFGGDPSRVTIFGQSTGAIGVCALIASPLATGKFHRAILQSQGCRAYPLEKEEASGVALANQVGCGSHVSSCLRNEKSVLELLKGAGRRTYFPLVDGVLLKDQPLNVIAQGKHNRVPLIVGNTRDEYTKVFTVPFQTVSDELASIGRTPEQITSAAAYYRQTHLEPWAWVKMQEDINFACLQRDLLRTTNVPTYRYLFDYAPSPFLELVGAFHGAELPYLFGTIYNATVVGVPYRATKTDERVEKILQTAWGSFAATGVPLLPEGNSWPAFNSNTERHLYIGDTVKIGSGLRNEQCDAMAFK